MIQVNMKSIINNTDFRLFFMDNYKQKQAGFMSQLNQRLCQLVCTKI